MLAANQGSVAESFPLGHRQPIIPPLGAAFLVNSTAAEVDEWLRRVPDASRDRLELYRAQLGKVRQRGYSLLAAGPELLQRHQAVLAEFELSQRLPRQERAVRQATSELADVFCPDLRPGQRYDLASIVVPIPIRADLPPMAIRLTGLPARLWAQQIESWVGKLKRVAALAAASMNGSLR